MRRWMTVVVFSLAAASFTGCGPSVPKVRVTDPANPEFYTQNVQPILQSNCYRCHGWMNHRGGLNVQTKAALLKGGKNGPALVPGDPSRSLLMQLIRHEGPASHPMPMPPKKPKLSDADIATIEQWIKAGALMPEVPVW